MKNWYPSHSIFKEKLECYLEYLFSFISDSYDVYLTGREEPGYFVEPENLTPQISWLCQPWLNENSETNDIQPEWNIIGDITRFDSFRIRFSKVNYGIPKVYWLNRCYVGNIQYKWLGYSYWNNKKSNN